MNFQQRVTALVQLGNFFSQVLEQKEYELFYKAHTLNPWFTPVNIRISVSAWAHSLTQPKLDQWLSAYTFTEKQPKTVAIIMAGNIPLVGLHDLICVLVSGNKALVKLSEDDKTLMNWVIDTLIAIEPEFEKQITISEARLPKNFDAVIATGSNNTNRYFEYYFRDKPSLLRANRNSVAVLTGKETPEDFLKLGADIFTYFGLGCRNVSKLYVPEGYDFIPFYEGIEPLNDIVNHHKYANNYTYHKAIYLMNLDKHLDNNFLLVKEDDAIASPLGVMFYSTYKTLDEVQTILEQRANEVQCIVSKTIFPNALPLGKAQEPELWDYADGVDTLEFLTKV
jgi:hypothetical protein